uniref:Uncharacterized protein n=1 Tax=Tanacetum cinerariifolium TaxID=118510 RepID=A0A6L2N2Q2_TANCI|nr:hypothetical protein [Tanacetum cinerariifolium]
MHYPSWHKIEPKKKAGVLGNLRKVIEQYFAKVYIDNKSALKKEHWVLQPDRTRDNAARAIQNAQNRAKSKVICRQGSRPLAVLRDMQEEMMRLRDLGPNKYADRFWRDMAGTSFLSTSLEACTPPMSMRSKQKVVRSDDRMSQLLTQLQSQNEVGSGSGSGGGRDDESGEDEDVDGSPGS